MHWDDVYAEALGWPMKLFAKFFKPEFLTYLVVGGLTFLLYFGFIAMSVELTHLDYRVGVTIAYVFAVSFHFFANRRFTFRAVDGRVIHQSVRYIGVLLVNYLITMGVVSLCVSWLGLSPYLGAAASIVVTIGVGYFSSKFWVFRKNESLHEQ